MFYAVYCEPTTVFRVEDRYGGGPYTGINCIPGLSYKHSDKQHPGWGEDGLWDAVRGHESLYQWLAGFLSMGDAIDWFAEEWDELELRGFSLVERRARKIAIGYSGLQVIFLPAY